MATLVMESGSVSTTTLSATPFLVQEIVVSLDTNSTSTLANPNVADADPAVNDVIIVPNQGPDGAVPFLVQASLNDRNLTWTHGSLTDNELSLGTFTVDVTQTASLSEENTEITTGGAAASATLAGSTVGSIQVTLRGESGNTAAINGAELRLIAFYAEQASGGIALPG